MNILVDLLLSKVIEDLSPLTESIERLHRMGYINNFELARDQLICVETRLGVSVSNVVVDEIFEYEDKESALAKVCLFTVHELKYRRKGIFMAKEGTTRLHNR